MRTRFAFLAILPLLLAACAGLASQANPQTITVEAQAMHYQPASIEVTAGQPVRLIFKNNDSVDHDFSVMDIPLVTGTMAEAGSPMPGHDMTGMASTPSLHMAAAMGTTSTLEFTASRPGTYTFFCTVAGHQAAGMQGTLVVKAP